MLYSNKKENALRNENFISKLYSKDKKNINFAISKTIYLLDGDQQEKKRNRK